MRAPTIRNGARGISVFPVIFRRERIIKKRLATVPSQKAKKIAVRPKTNPSNQPNPRTSLASPRPIHRPLETSQSKTKGRASNGPDKSAHLETGQTKIEPIPLVLMKTEPSAKRLKR